MKKDNKEKKSGAIPVVFATNEAYAPYLSAAIASVAEHLSGERSCEVTVLHTGLSEKTVAALERGYDRVGVRCLDISASLAHLRERMYASAYIGEEMYYRAMIPKLFPGLGRVIYLDCDLSVLCDISELYEMNMRGKALLAAKNPMHPKMRDYVNELGLDPDGYVNSGVLLMDCERLRSLGFTERFFAELGRRRELNLPDQDLINIILKDEIGYLAPEWNYLWHMKRLYDTGREELRMPTREAARYFELQESARILHYSGDVKPWVQDGLCGAEHFRRFAEISSMRDEIYLRRRKAVISEEKVKLVFADILSGRITLTCAHQLPRGIEPRELSYTLDGVTFEPELVFERELVRGGVAMRHRIFQVQLLLPQKNERIELSFKLGGSPALFEYEKFFPLNGRPASYFAYRGALVFREGRRLVLEASTRSSRLCKELRYLGALLRDGSAKSVKAVLLRLAYPILCRILPKRIWLLSDRPEVAGDNGEALFRYLSRKRPEGVNPYFVIRRSSPDYRRLKRVGKVIAAGSLKHKLFSLAAEVKAVSQTDAELYHPIDPSAVKDILMKQKRIFLQHGVTKDDISASYSRYAQGFDLFITAAYPEYFSVICNPAYGLGPSRVALTGFPRHDLLGAERERMILVCPTWRKSLLPGGRAEPALFRSSRYFSAWRDLLSDGALPSLAERYGYRVVLLPHRNVLPYLDMLAEEISPSVELATGGERYKELLSRAALTVTDYSSVAFESAYLGRAVVYYLFDEQSFFSSHTCKAGYFDYRRDGFGESASDLPGLLLAIERSLASGCPVLPDYAAGREAFFAHRDKENSRRVSEAILRLCRRS